MRINNLDYLRGFMAFAIMVYHYSSWTLHPFKSDSVLGVLGIYGVSIFYILSGLTLFVVYHQKLELSSLKNFFIKRVFRIFPLLWLSILGTIFLSGTKFPFKTILLNATGLFGVIEIDKYIATGSWSIGNELVFYLFFPIVLIIATKRKWFLELFFALSLAIGIGFAFYFLNSNLSISEQWKTYINPFNQLFLFVGGMVIGKYFKNLKNNSLSLIILIISLVVLVLLSVEGDLINIVTGVNRFVYSLIGFGLTFSFLIGEVKLPKWLQFILSQLGHISYSLYLIHPIVFWTFSKFSNRLEQPYFYMITCYSITIVSSLIIYYLVEKRFMNLGKKLVFRLKTES